MFFWGTIMSLKRIIFSQGKIMSLERIIFSQGKIMSLYRRSYLSFKNMVVPKGNLSLAPLKA
jgi:hypothetical protein